MTLIINKATMGYCDFESRKIIAPSNVMRLEEKESDYLHKKIEKLFNLNLKEVKNINKGVKNLLACMTGDNDDFIDASKLLFNELINMCATLDNSPNAHVLFINFSLNNNNFIAIIKLNNKKVDTYKIHDNYGTIIYKWQMPASSATVEEGIIMNNTTSDVYLLEKKFEIDGKKDFYLNEHWLMGEKQLSYKEILDITLKSIYKLANAYDLENKNEIPILFKEYINIAFEQCEDIYPYLIADEMNFDHYFVDEIHKILEALGIDENIVIPNKLMGLLDNKYSKCKVKLDEEIEVTMSVDEYLEGTRFHYERIADKYSVSLDDIQSVEFK